MTKWGAHKTLWHLNLIPQCFNWFSIPLKRCDAPVNMKLPANSPYCPTEKQAKICLREQNILPAEDGLTTDVRINICRYQLPKKLNIHLNSINGYQKTSNNISLLIAKTSQMLTNKTFPDKTNLEMRHFNNLLTDF